MTGPDGTAWDDFTFAYQPIIDAVDRQVVSYEALVRGPGGEPAHQVLERFTGAALQGFDVLARRRAIELAVRLGLPCCLNLNLLPAAAQATGTVALTSTVEMAREQGLGPGRLVLEVSERETVEDVRRFVDHADLCRELGVQFAIDDFGAGYAGLTLLADFQPDSLKLDMSLVRRIHQDGPRQAIVRGVAHTCGDLGIDIVAEGVESVEEYAWLRGAGITLFQGFLFARPGFRALPEPTYPEPSTASGPSALPAPPTPSVPARVPHQHSPDGVRPGS